MKTSKVLLLGAVLAALTLTASAQTWLTNGLAAYYPLDGDATDASGYGKHGTNFGATVTTGARSIPNSALHFSGRANRVDIGDKFGFGAIGSSYSVSYWVKSTQSSYGYIIGDYNHPESTFAFVSELSGDNPGEVYGQMRYDTDDNILLSSTKVNDGVWHQVLTTIDGVGGFRIYVDGILRNQKAYDTTKNYYDASFWRIGNVTLAGGFTEPFVGDLDEIRIFNRALSALEAAELYDVERPKLTDGLVAYYPFNGDANDASGNGKHGVVSGGAAPATDRFGLPQNAFSFNGVDAYISTPKWLTGIQNNWTITFWAEFGVQTANPPEKALILHRASFQDKDLYMLQGQLLCGDRSGQGNPGVVTSVSATNGNWNQYVFVSSAGSLKLYKNAVLVSTATKSFQSDWDAGYYGSYIGGNGHDPLWHGSFLGKLDDIRVYDRTLSINEVAQLYAIEAGPRVDLLRAVRPSFSNLTISTNYQLQVSGDLNTWTNHGSAFTATSTNMIWPQYFDVDDWGSLFFRLQSQ